MCENNKYRLELLRKVQLENENKRLKSEKIIFDSIESLYSLVVTQGEILDQIINKLISEKTKWKHI